jgi:hypothetical protein
MLCELVGLFWHCASLSFLKSSKWEVEVERITKSKLGVGTFECLFHVLVMLGRPRKRES